MKKGIDNEKLQENAIKQPGITERRPYMEHVMIMVGHTSVGACEVAVWIYFRKSDVVFSLINIFL